MFVMFVLSRHDFMGISFKDKNGFWTTCIEDAMVFKTKEEADKCCMQSQPYTLWKIVVRDKFYVEHEIKLKENFFKV